MDLTAPKAATWLGVTLPTIHRLVERGRLSGRRVGRRLLIDVDSLEELAATYDPKEHRVARDRERQERRARMRRGE